MGCGANGSLDRFRSLPIWRPAPIVGALIGEAARCVLAALIVIGLGLALGFRPVAGALGAAAAITAVFAPLTFRRHNRI